MSVCRIRAQSTREFKSFLQLRKLALAGRGKPLRNFPPAEPGHLADGQASGAASVSTMAFTSAE